MPVNVLLHTWLLLMHSHMLAALLLPSRHHSRLPTHVLSLLRHLSWMLLHSGFIRITAFRVSWRWWSTRRWPGSSTAWSGVMSWRVIRLLAGSGDRAHRVSTKSLHSSSHHHIGSASDGALLFLQLLADVHAEWHGAWITLTVFRVVAA